MTATSFIFVTEMIEASRGGAYGTIFIDFPRSEGRLNGVHKRASL